MNLLLSITLISASSGWKRYGGNLITASVIESLIDDGSFGFLADVPLTTDILPSMSIIILSILPK